MASPGVLYKVEERLFTVEECHNAAEAVITSATMFVQAVVKIDDAVIGDGKPGTISNQLREAYIAEAMAEIAD